MVKTLKGTLLGVVLLTAFQAPTALAKKWMYVDGAVGQSETTWDDTGVDYASKTAYRLSVGMNLIQNEYVRFSPEVFYHWLATDSDAQQDLYTWGIGGKLDCLLYQGQASIFFKYGFNQLTAEYTGTDSEKDSSFKYYLGGGAQYEFIDMLYVGVDYMYYTASLDVAGTSREVASGVLSGFLGVRF